MPDPEFDDPVLGRVTRNEKYGYYEGTFPPGDGLVSFCLYTDDAGDVSTTRERARQIFSDFARVSKESEDYLVAELLEVKNDGWLDEDGPLTDEQFRARLEPGWIEFSPDGFVTLYYGCDEMFTDHGLSVTMDEFGDFVSAGVEG